MSARPSVGGALAAFLLALGGCSGDGGDPPVEEVSFSEVNEILEAKCTFACHSGGEFAAGGLDLADDPHAALVDQNATTDACANGSFKRIAPGAPENSLLYAKLAARLEGTEPPCGSMMPPGENDAPVTAEELETLRGWIEAGAPADG